MKPGSLTFVRVGKCGELKKAGVTSRQRIDKSCEVSRVARTDFGEPERTFVGHYSKKSADRPQPVPQCTK